MPILAVIDHYLWGIEKIGLGLPFPQIEGIGCHHFGPCFDNGLTYTYAAVEVGL